MKMNSNNLFGKLSEEQCEMLVALSESMTLEDLLKALREAPEPIVCSVPTLSRFLGEGGEAVAGCGSVG
jgi:hypothetical protein